MPSVLPKSRIWPNKKRKQGYGCINLVTNTSSKRVMPHYDNIHDVMINFTLQLIRHMQVESWPIIN